MATNKLNKERLQDFREFINSIDWFNLDEITPENGEECLVKTKFSVDIFVYFAEEDKDDPYWRDSWDGPGFYDFDEYGYNYFKKDSKLWLPIKR